MPGFTWRRQRMHLFLPHTYLFLNFLMSLLMFTPFLLLTYTTSVLTSFLSILNMWRNMVPQCQIPKDDCVHVIPHLQLILGTFQNSTFWHAFLAVNPPSQQQQWINLVTRIAPRTAPGNIHCVLLHMLARRQTLHWYLHLQRHVKHLASMVSISLSGLTGACGSFSFPDSWCSPCIS